MEKVILFDLDGTVIDSTDAIVQTCLYTCEKLGFDFQGTQKDIEKTIGYPLEIMFEKMGVDSNATSKFVKTYKNRYRTISLAQTTLLPQAQEALYEASSFARLGVVTTKTTQYTIPILKQFDIFDCFEVIIGRQEVQNPKPHPEPILKAMEQMGVCAKTQKIYMIGDTKLDLIAANEANVAPVGVLSGYGQISELKCYTSAIFRDCYEAVKFLKKV